MMIFIGICVVMVGGFNAGHLVYLASAGSKKDRIKAGIAGGILGAVLTLLCILS
jgi:hypothetical protein